MFLSASLLLPMISVVLSIWGFRRTKAMLSRISPIVVDAAGDLVSQDRAGMLAVNFAAKHSIAQRKKMAVHMVRAAARYLPWTATCLEESLALWFLLRQRGIASDIRIGARKEFGKFEAHAWVENDGEALNETPKVRQQYAVFGHATIPVEQSE